VLDVGIARQRRALEAVDLGRRGIRVTEKQKPLEMVQEAVAAQRSAQ
jgi:hypothetical protein